MNRRHCDWVQFEIHSGQSRRPVAAIKIQVLDTNAAQQHLVDTLRASRLRLWVRNRRGFYLARTVTHSSGSLVPEFTLSARDFAPFIPQFNRLLTLELHSPAGRLELNRQPIKLGGELLRFRGPAVPLENTELFAEAGNYRLVARVGDREIAHFPFELLSRTDLLRQIEVSRIQIQAQTRAGDLVQGVTTLHWEEHKGFQASVEIISPTTASDALVSCTAYVRDGTNVLLREDLIFPLDRFSRKLTLQPVRFGGPGLQTQPKPARLSVSLAINGTEKAQALVLILPPERITNFEGQLTFEVNDLPFDEVEYAQIVQRLGLPNQTSARRGFWRWLQSKLF